MNYDDSIRKAALAGYEKVIDEKGFLGSYFVKDKKLWVHDLERLLNKLGWNYNHQIYLKGSEKEKIAYDQQINEILEPLGYNLEDYRKYGELPLRDAFKLVISEMPREKLITELNEATKEGIINSYHILGGKEGKPLYLKEGFYLYPEGSFSVEENELSAEEELLEIFSDAFGDNDMVYLSDGVYLTRDGELIDTKSS